MSRAFFALAAATLLALVATTAAQTCEASCTKSMLIDGVEVHERKRPCLRSLEQSGAGTPLESTGGGGAATRPAIPTTHGTEPRSVAHGAVSQVPWISQECRANDAACVSSSCTAGDIKLAIVELLTQEGTETCQEGSVVVKTLKFRLTCTATSRYGRRGRHTHLGH